MYCCVQLGAQIGVTTPTETILVRGLFQLPAPNLRRTFNLTEKLPGVVSFHWSHLRRTSWQWLDEDMQGYTERCWFQHGCISRQRLLITRHHVCPHVALLAAPEVCTEQGCSLRSLYFKQSTSWPRKMSSHAALDAEVCVCGCLTVDKLPATARSYASLLSTDKEENGRLDTWVRCDHRV